MVKIVLDKKEDQVVELHTNDNRICSFCSQVGVCVTGSFPTVLEVEVPKYELIGARKLIDSGDGFYLSRSDVKMSSRDKIKSWSVYCFDADKIPFQVVYAATTKIEKVVKKEDADICHDCIRQLSKLIK